MTKPSAGALRAASAINHGWVEGIHEMALIIDRETDGSKYSKPMNYSVQVHLRFTKSLRDFLFGCLMALGLVLSFILFLFAFLASTHR